MITLYLTQIKKGLSVSIQGQNENNYCQIKFYQDWNTSNLISAVKISTVLIKNLNKEKQKTGDDEPLALLFLDFSTAEKDDKKGKTNWVDKDTKLKDNLEYYINESENSPVLPLTSLIVNCKSRYVFTGQIEEIVKVRYEWDSIEITNNRNEALEFIAMG